MSKTQENTNVKKVGNMIIKNIHRTTNENTLTEIINQKITNLIQNDLQTGGCYVNL